MRISRSPLTVALWIATATALPCLAEHEHPLPPDAAKLEAFEKARTKGELLFDLGTMYRKAGRTDDALAAYRKIADLDIPVLENHPESRDAAGKRLMIYAIMADLLREKKDYAGALKSLAEGEAKVAADTNLPPPMKLRVQVDLLKAQAHIEQEQGNIDQAAQTLEKAVSLVEK